MTARRVLVLTASMGAGHDGVAGELARRLTLDGARVLVIDVLRLLPLRLGPLLRWWYRTTVLRTPWIYEIVYQVFFVPRRHTRGPSAAPLARLAAARLARIAADFAPGEVVSTFHLAAQVTGLMRARGTLHAPSTVLVTDFAIHLLWLHPGNDRYLCPSPDAAARVTALTRRPASTYAPLVRPAFHAPARPGGIRARVGAGPRDRLVLVSAGAWGAGHVTATARTLAASGRYTPVVLCGGNARLRRRLAAAGLGPVLGWRDDLPELMAAAYALVDNAAGLTCVEAFAAGLPVVSHRPIPGHGRDGALAMARAGLTTHAPGAAALLAALDHLADPRHRARQVAAASALFTAPPACGTPATPISGTPARSVRRIRIEREPVTGSAVPPVSGHPWQDFDLYP
ncbi:MGDG synthase family glycosyltransferase [Sphaerisporangium aureirubrum]|uniref:Diacylglycerol glucosyltransferase N-terminal domain-containing protein n=1 Tax=Sphaerisporangium aureirubrum TaxID=1544736 RepID=A0ABW1NJ16_9ACTN